MQSNALCQNHASFQTDSNEPAAATGPAVSQPLTPASPESASALPHEEEGRTEEVEEEMEEGTDASERQMAESEDGDENSDAEDGLNVEGFEREENIVTNDPGLWPAVCTDQDREDIVRKLAVTMREKKVEMPCDSGGKPFPEYLNYTKSANKREKIKRDWLTFSQSNQSLYCIPCVLFSSIQKKPSCSALASQNGFKMCHVKWRHMYNKLPIHERSDAHRDCYLRWKNLQRSVLQDKGIDSLLNREFQTEIEKNRAILEKLLDVTLHLASRNLPFRGKTSDLDDVHNGNFLGTLELLSHYDPLLKEHFQKIRDNKQKKKEGKQTRLTHYLSSESQNEFINLCGRRVLKRILQEREDAIYYAVIADATPDISHTEQNVVVLRYVKYDKEKDEWEITERFLEFKDFYKKTGSEIAKMIESVLCEHGIDVSDCRGQGYDNGANMSGKVKGVQAEILRKNKLATYSPCASHTLNLVGVHAAKSSPDVSTFFGCINRLYTFVSSSPERWAIYKEQTGSSLHQLSDTRWSARIEAVKPVAKHLPSVINALDSILMTCSLTNEARSDANGLRKYFMSFDAILLLTIWLKVLQSIDDRNVILQSGKISLDIEAANIRALTEEMQSLRDAWGSLLAEAKLIAREAHVTPQLSKECSRKKKRKRFHDETCEEETTQEDSETEFRNTVVYTAMDSIISDLDTRFKRIADIVNEFYAVLKVGQISEDKISSVCHPLITKYSSDLTPDFENQESGSDTIAFSEPDEERRQHTYIIEVIKRSLFITGKQLTR
ncbi:Zinc finger MYM-type protein 1 [Anabarilius grahami]|uniref:Zinc finger MYM-type protein 1 n=1 Tax=Anabarilius grahami TaxID=495550 RepID=A0A3N0Y6Q5_ANAGA|nr:Zinc finger MYM-type protein 1 [Anabarilius grahami]